MSMKVPINPGHGIFVEHKPRQFDLLSFSCFAGHLINFLD